MAAGEGDVVESQIPIPLVFAVVVVLQVVVALRHETAVHSYPAFLYSCLASAGVALVAFFGYLCVASLADARSIQILVGVFIGAALGLMAVAIITLFASLEAWHLATMDSRQDKRGKRGAGTGDRFRQMYFDKRRELTRLQTRLQRLEAERAAETDEDTSTPE